MRANFRFFLITALISIIFIPFGRSNNAGKNIQDDTRVSVVVIDPGHGGKDYGARVANANEKEIVLDIALKLGNLIRKNYPETKIIYTRTSDIFIPLHERARIANSNKADLFISIHANAVANKNVQGTETFVLGMHRSADNLEIAKQENAVILLEDDYSTTYEGFDPNSSESYIMFELLQDEYLDQSVMFASEIQHQFRENANRKDRSVKQAGFLVLRQTTMPSVLVEAGFISNYNERSYLLSEKGKKNIATSIFSAFSEYKKSIEQRSSFTINTSTEKEIKKDNPKPAQHLIYSVQIAALKRDIKTIPSNFKGEKNIFKKSSGKITRYFSGRFQNYDDAENEKKRLNKKYKNAFVVAFDGDQLISVKK